LEIEQYTCELVRRSVCLSLCYTCALSSYVNISLGCYRPMSLLDVEAECRASAAASNSCHVAIPWWLFHALSENFLLVFVRFFTLENWNCSIYI